MANHSRGRADGRRYPHRVCTMDVDKNRIRQLLQDALIALSLPADEQIRVTHPGCVSCELIENFTHGYQCFCQSCADELSDDTAALLTQIDDTIESLADDDCTCFDNTVMNRPKWAELRRLATRAIDAMGWAGFALKPYSEIEPGVWQRDNSTIVRGSDED